MQILLGTEVPAGSRPDFDLEKIIGGWDTNNQSFLNRETLVPMTIPGRISEPSIHWKSTVWPRSSGPKTWAEVTHTHCDEL